MNRPTKVLSAKCSSACSDSERHRLTKKTLEPGLAENQIQERLRQARLLAEDHPEWSAASEKTAREPTTSLAIASPPARAPVTGVASASRARRGPVTGVASASRARRGPVTRLASASRARRGLVTQLVIGSRAPKWSKTLDAVGFRAAFQSPEQCTVPFSRTLIGQSTELSPLQRSQSLCLLGPVDSVGPLRAAVLPDRN